MVNYSCVNFILKEFGESKALAFFLICDSVHTSRLKIDPRDKHKPVVNVADNTLMRSNPNGSDPEDARI